MNPLREIFFMFMTGMLPRMVRMVKSPWDRRSSGTRAIPASIALSGEGGELPALEEDLPLVVVHAVDGAGELGLSRARPGRRTRRSLPRGPRRKCRCSLWLERLLTCRMASLHSPSLGVYCSKTVFPIIILISSDRSLISRHGLGVDVPAVPHDGDVVPQLEDLVQAVGDVDDGHVLLPQALDDREQPL